MTHRRREIAKQSLKSPPPKKAFDFFSLNKKCSPEQTESNINLFEQISVVIKWDNLFIIYDELVDWKLSAALSLLLALGGWSYQSTDQ